MIALASVATLSLMACGGDDATDTTTTSNTEASMGSVVPDSTAMSTSESGIEVTGAWARTSPMMASMGAAYMTIVSANGDRLLAAAVDSSIADHAEVHEVVPSDGTDTSMAMGSDTTMAMGSDTSMSMPSTEMVMREVESIDLPAGEMVMLKPGGYHVMLIDLVSPLEIGQTFDVTLTFETAGDVVVSVEVREDAP